MARVGLRSMSLTLLVVACAAAPAGAAVSSQIGVGYEPDILVPAGTTTAHIAWTQGVSGNDQIVYCTLPRGASACSNGPTTLPLPDANFGSDVEILPGPAGTITILTERTTGVYSINFAPGAAAFGAWTKVGDVGFFRGNAIVGPTGTSFIGATTRTVQAYNSPPPPGSASLTPSFAIPTDGALGYDPTTNRLVALSSDGDNIESFYFTPAAYSVTSVNTATNWSGPTKVEPPGDDVVIASGPRGLFMLNNGRIGPGVSQFFVHKWQGTSFGGAIAVSGVETGYQYDLFQQGTTGTLLAAWRQNAPGSSGSFALARLRLATSTDGGATWSAPRDVVRESELNDIASIKVAAAADDQGFAVFTGEGPATSGFNRPIRASSLETLPPETVATPTPTPTPTPTATPKPAAAAAVIPKASQAIRLPSAKKCISRNVVRIKFVRPPGSPAVRRIQVFLNGKSVRVLKGFVPTATVNLKRLPTKAFTFKAVLTYVNGKKLTAVRKYKPCSKKKTKPKRPKSLT